MQDPFNYMLIRRRYCHNLRSACRLRAFVRPVGMFFINIGLQEFFIKILLNTKFLNYLYVKVQIKGACYHIFLNFAKTCDLLIEPRLCQTVPVTPPPKKINL
jgi:hypothetical protein